MNIITPISPEYKKLLRDNPELSDLKEFFTDYIARILEKKEKNNKFLEKQEFENFKWYLENILEYKEILEKKWIKNKSLFFIEKIIFSQTTEEFEDFLGDKKIIYFIKYVKENNLNKLFELKNFTKYDLLELVNNKILVYIILYINYNALNKIWELLKIKTKYDLLELAKNGIFKYIIEINNLDIDEISKYINILKSKEKNTYNIIVWSNNKDVGVCKDNEIINLNILLWNSDNYIPFYIWYKIIWILKKDWKKSFLSFENVFDNEWELIFVKWFIYNIMIDWKFFEESNVENYEKIDLLDFKWKITRNPMRPINEFCQEKFNEYNNTDGLENTFDDIVENFKNVFLKK